MASHDTDPEEFTGRDHATKADPKGKPVKAAPVKSTPLAAELAAPAPSVAVYEKPKEGEAHPQHARLAPALRLDEAEQNLNTAQLELNAAYNRLRACERTEAEALSAFTNAVPGPSQSEVHRELLAKETARKLERTSQGLPAVEPKVPTHGKSAVDIAASQRPRTSAQQPNAPLRSPIARR